MSVTNWYDSPVAQFQDNPLTKNWPEPAAIDALFRYCVRRFFSLCQADPRTWLTEADLHALLAQTLHEELPGHGLPSCAVHLGYSLAAPSKADGQKKPGQPLDLVLVIPETIHWEADNKSEAALALIAAVKLGHEPVGVLREELTRLSATQEKLHGLPGYLVVMGFHDEQNAIDTISQAAREAGITYLGDNYTSLANPVTQAKLL